MADETDDLEYSDTNVGSAQAQGVRKNISLKLKVKGRGRGRRGSRGRRGVSTKKALSGTAEDDDETEESIDVPNENIPSDKQFGDSTLDEVISKLETPAFSPMDRTFPEPLHQNKKLRWDHKVNLIGEKVIDPHIHCCEKCSLPILNYARMLPCKHVSCFDCAKKNEKICPKCNERVQKIEQSALGTVFMCTFEGTRHAPGPCSRTYLSQRDLHAHINHRHLKPPTTSVSTTSVITLSIQSSSTTNVGPSPVTISRDPRDHRGHLQVDVSHQPVMVSHVQHPQEHRDPIDHSRNQNIAMGSPAGQPRQYPHSPANYPSTIPVSSARPNLITVPIQDDGASLSMPPTPHVHPQPHVPQYATSVTPAHPIPSMQHPPSSYPPHAYQHPHPAPAVAYSQAPPITTQTFSQPPPPVVHHQPPMHAPSGPIYSTPPPVVQHHAPPPTYTPPRAPQHVPRAIPPPQRFPPSSGTYDENAAYMQQWASGGVPPPPARTTLPPRPITAPPPSSNPSVGLIQPLGPSDSAYRQQYYQ